MKKVLVFGTFDGIHDGHHFFIDAAKACGDTLVIAVATDASVQRYKGRLPKLSLLERMKALSALYSDACIEAGDDDESFAIIRKIKPDIIMLGYDQTELKAALNEFRILSDISFLIETAGDYEGDRLHSSLLAHDESLLY